MTDRHFLFTDEMVRRILTGEKTQTRRPLLDREGMLPPAGSEFLECHWSVPAACFSVPKVDGPMHWSARLPAATGDVLIGRECWRLECTVGAGTEWALSYRSTGTTRYFSTYNDPELGDKCSNLTIRSDGRWRPSIHMPRWAARIVRPIMGVRVERLRDISEADAVAEGIIDGGCETCGESSHPNPCGCSNPRPVYADAFAWLWDSIYADRGLGWSVNPWVVVVEFDGLK